MIISNLESCFIDEMKCYQNLSYNFHLCHTVQTSHLVPSARFTVATLDKVESGRKHNRSKWCCSVAQGLDGAAGHSTASWLRLRPLGSALLNDWAAGAMACAFYHSYRSRTKDCKRPQVEPMAYICMQFHRLIIINHKLSYKEKKCFIILIPKLHYNKN